MSECIYCKKNHSNNLSLELFSSSKITCILDVTSNTERWFLQINEDVYIPITHCPVCGRSLYEENELIVLKCKMKYEDIEEIVGIFENKNIESAKNKYMAKMPEINISSFNFITESFILNKVY